MLYTGSAFLPKRALKLISPKKYQPMMVEKAKNSMHMAMKASPNQPNFWLKGQLGQSGTGGTASEDAGGEDHHSGEGEDHEGVNKDADHGDLALFLGVLYLSQGMGMRSGAHTGLIAEQTSCHTDAHCLLNADTSGAAHNCLCAESGSKDHAQGFGDSLMVDHQESGAADDVEERHNRDNLFGEGGDGGHRPGR